MPKVNIRIQKLKVDAFYILKYLKQHNDYDRHFEDIKFEEECYNSVSYDYLM